MKVLSIDPGFGRCGIAIIFEHGSSVELIYSTCVITDMALPFAERLLIVGNTLEQLIKEYNPDLLAIEELYFSNNQKTALRVAEVRGMILYIAKTHRLRIREYNPLSVKIALTGYGRASKDQVILMVQKLISLPKEKKLDDEYDSIAVGLTALAEEKNLIRHGNN